MQFFTPQELQTVAKKIIDKKELMPECNKCKLNKGCKHPKIDISGKGGKKILVIADTPSAYEDIYGTALSGIGGSFLKREMKKHGYSLTKDCWSTYAVPCWTEKDIKRDHVKKCRPRIESIIAKLKPRHIILIGEFANLSILGSHFKYTNTTRWRGLSFQDVETKAVIHCLLNPYLMEEDREKQKDRSYKAVFNRDVKNLCKKLKNSPRKIENYEKRVKILSKHSDVIHALENILKTANKIAFDYEATGLKPYVKGQKIVSISIAISAKEAIVFPYDHTDIWTREELLAIRKLWLAILEKKSILKIAHNSKFEDNWSAVCVGTRPKGWYWDTQNSAHIIDNRAKFTKLKFQTFIWYGIRPYDKSVAKYLDSKGKEFNTVEEAPLKDLLIYNGLDSLFTFMLYEDHKKFLSNKKGLIKAMSFFDKGNVTMGEIQLNGIPTDEKYLKKQNKELKKKVKDIKKYLIEGKEAQKFKKKIGRTLNYNSNKDLGVLVYDVLGKPAIYTNAKTKNYKTDAPTLEKLNLPFIKKLIEMKKLEKARGTYLAQFIRAVCNGVMHPFFDLNVPVTYRSSSSNPNFQNIPKRFALVAKIIRQAVRPSPGCCIGELDFSGAEVITSVCYHKDPTFYDYLTDKTSDMHRDNACDLWLLKPEQVSKMIRFFAKNMWTFAQFYGDWYGSCAPNLWETCLELELADGQILQDHIFEKGITTLEDFLEHCKEVERKLWNERFPVYTQWKNDIVEFYLEHGYIETYLGFRFQGLMSRNQCCNYPIQGTSFHMLVYTLNKVSKFIKENNLKTKLIGQIHDSIISDTPLEEWDFYVKGVRKIVKGLQKEFPWLIIPMEIEAERSKSFEEGGTLAEMSEFKLSEYGE